MKRLYALTVTLLIVILSMSVSVFAWFSHAHYNSKTEGFAGDTIVIEPTPEGDREKVDIFKGESIDYLTYLSIDDFNNPLGSSYLSGFASVVNLTLENQNPESIWINLLLEGIIAPEYGDLSGSIGSLKYIILDENESFETVYQNVLNYNMRRTFYENINGYNRNKRINIESSKPIKVYIWGDFQNLTEKQKQHMQLVTYRIMLNMQLFNPPTANN